MLEHDLCYCYITYRLVIRKETYSYDCLIHNVENKYMVIKYKYIDDDTGDFSGRLFETTFHGIKIIKTFDKRRPAMMYLRELKKLNDGYTYTYATPL